MGHLICFSLFIIMVASSSQYISAQTLVAPLLNQSHNGIISGDNQYVLFTYKLGAQMYLLNDGNYTQFGLPLIKSPTNSTTKSAAVGTFTRDASRIVIATSKTLITITDRNFIRSGTIKNYTIQESEQVILSRDGEFLLYTYMLDNITWLFTVQRWNGSAYSASINLNASSALESQLRISNNNLYLVACSDVEVKIYKRNVFQFLEFNLLDTITLSSDDCDINDDVLVVVGTNLMNIYIRSNNSDMFTLKQTLNDTFPLSITRLTLVDLSRDDNSLRIIVTNQQIIAIYQRKNGLYQLQSTISSIANQTIIHLDISDDFKTILATGQIFNATYIYVACFNYISNCLQCLNQTECSKCNQTFYLNSNNKCQLCSSTIPNCLTCVSQSTCILCQTGYQLKNTTICQSNQNSSNQRLIIILLITIPSVCLSKSQQYTVTHIIILCWYCYAYNSPSSLNQDNYLSKSAQIINQQIYSSNKSIRLSKKQQKQLLSTMLCSICLQHNVTHQGTCRHFYHKNCIDQWIKRGNNCPQCYKPMPAQSITSLHPSKVIRFPSKQIIKN